MNMDTAVKLKQRNLELKKHVAIIHSNSKISLLQRKISNALLYHAYEKLLTEDEHRIHITVLTKLIGYDSHDHKKVKQALMDLLSTVVEWNIVDGDKVDKEGVWNASSIIADVSIEGSMCTYSYSGKMRKLLYHPSIYGRLNMSIQAKFQSSYGLALYENCNRYQDIGKTPWFDIDKFRKLMGVEEDKYKIFRDFKIRVLDKSLEEINKYSSLIVAPVLKKQNRQVVAIQFSIKKIANQKMELPSSENDNSLEFLLKNKYGLSQKQMVDAISKYENAYIREKIELIESSTGYLAGKIKNLGKYLICALSEDYQAVKTSPVKNKRKNYHAITDQKNVKKQVFEIFSGIDETAQNEILEKFKNKLSKTYLSLFLEDGFEHVLVQDQFLKYILNSKNEISRQIFMVEDEKTLVLHQH